MALSLLSGLFRKANSPTQFPDHDPDPLAEVRALIKKSKSADALSCLNQIKSRRQPIRDVDYLRALCFLNKSDPFSAIEALKEELRFFPSNQPAARLLKKFTAKYQSPCSSKDPEFREIFNIVRPYTMLSEARLHSLFDLAKQICLQDVPGNFVECGVAAGGSSALLGAVMVRHSRQPRKLFCFDTFEGMPTASALDVSYGKPADTIGWGEGTCAASVASLREICQKLSVEKKVEPIKGLFADTLPANRERIGPIAFLHIDGDWYSSTRDVLENLFDQVVSGGRIQIDDYGYWEGCRRAVHEFEKARGLELHINQIDETGVWIAR